MYMMYARVMTSTTASAFRADQGTYLDLAQREPVEITSRGARRRAYVVSPEFYDRAIEALEDRDDVAAAARARHEDQISHEDLMAELGL